MSQTSLLTLLLGILLQQWEKLTDMMKKIKTETITNWEHVKDVRAGGGEGRTETYHYSKVQDCVVIPVSVSLVSWDINHSYSFISTT